MFDENKIRDTAEAVKGVLQEVPIYKDAIQPTAKEIGRTLETIAKAVHAAILPLRALVWSVESFDEFLKTTLPSKLKNTPPDRIRRPPPNVFGPALESLRFVGDQPDLREMYANLLANSLDSATAINAHPAFVDIIKSMSPDEAKIMMVFSRVHQIALLDIIAKEKKSSSARTLYRNFSTVADEACCEHKELTPSYLDNLARLGLIDIPSISNLLAGAFTDKSLYEPLENSDKVLEAKKAFEAGSVDQNLDFSTRRRVASLTDFGLQFCNACIIDKALVVAGP